MQRFLIVLFLALCSLNLNSAVADAKTTLDFESESLLMSTTTSPTIYPIFDSQDHKLPRNFRVTVHESIQRPFINLEGLNQLNMSGSSQFSEKTFQSMVGSLSVPSNQLHVIDLREESHGFLNGVAVSWTDGNNGANRNKTKIEITSDENDRLNHCLQQKELNIIDHSGKSNQLAIYTIKTEQQLVENFGVNYIRLPVTDHKHPSNETVDEFLSIINHLPSDHWMHVHCKGGRGRTTTFISMYDIAKNAHQVSLEDILNRQWLIGGVDLTQTQKKNHERSQDAIERLEFLQAFYRYCQEVTDFQTSWSEWISQSFP